MKTFPKPYPLAAADRKGQSFYRSARFAWRGVRIAFKRELNLQRQLIIGVLVIAAGIVLHVTMVQLAILILTTAAVMLLVMVNSAIEALADALMPSYHDKVRDAKDMAAGAVLVMSFAAVAVGIVILLPPLLDLLVG